MKTVEELFKQSKAKIDRLEIVSEVGLKIKEIVDALNKGELKNWGGDELSRALTALALLRVNLGQELADAAAFYDFAYMSRKVKYASEWSPTKKRLNEKLNRATNQDVDSAILEEMTDNYASEIEMKHYAESLKTLYQSTETLVTALQSRLSILKEERRETKSY
jgi:signal transduction histidine kinase